MLCTALIATFTHISIGYGRLVGEFPMKLKYSNVSNRALDVVHTGLVWNGLWYYLIRNFGDKDIIDLIPL